MDQPGFKSRAIEAEYETVEAMIQLYCEKKHIENIGLCEECRNLLEYAGERLDKCPRRENKIPCSQCNIHCYSTEYREKIRDVMKFSGPKNAHSTSVEGFETHT
ncbi:MAG: nitrous oxide-stimulated promoter family protein [bacterium]|nr:nitrous oxide-stimulated promoter family protein [bacterium]